ncbi:MAG TPA: hypothetical protein DIT13_02875 [Verrucomicrobiales bacterium]|nr:hypothetical protein [Verrucomicrobiales bacterium]HRJ08055.1 DUF1588 domain-containing protein [Prosthecobacter sp.]HRK14513.1 DUF1588 domain-containing protein [Prosthecobacter sp.]
MKSFHTLSCVILVFSLCLASSSVWAADPAVPSFLKTYCADCHNPVKMKGKVSLTPLIENPASADPSLLQAVLDVVTSREMPPEDEKQPPSEARTAFLAAGSPLMKEVALNRAKEAELPGHGNLVPHAVLFTEPEVRRAATPARLWRMSPHLFMPRANQLTGARFLEPRRNQGGDGLHPAFAYMTPPHAFRDDAGQHLFEEATTELLFNVCWDIAGLQMQGKRVAPEIEALLQNKEPSDADWHPIIRRQYQMGLHRQPHDSEIAELMPLVEQTQRDSGRNMALQALLAAVLMKPEAVYRFEIGQGTPDAHGRVMLAPQELKHAIAYALTDSPPDVSLEHAAKEGRLAGRDDVRREVERLLGDFETTSPRLLRFFQEYFEYTAAPEVFKDHRQANAIFARERVEGADEMVLFILERDEDVLRRMLTEDRVFISDASEQREPVEKRFRRSLHPDYGFPPEWIWEQEQPVQPPQGRRSGILTHPAWLLAFSDNEKNQAIQRGLWVQTKLLGGSIPDTPVGVDAKLPADPHLTLREKMKQVTSATYCWSCHQKMDPLGLPFEQFDDFGAYRQKELERPVVTTGEIKIGVPEIDGPVADPFEMLARLSTSPYVEQVFVRHVFRYFLGRNETPDDAPTLMDAHEAYRKNNGSMRALAASLLTSDSFIYRRLPETLATK